MVRQHSMGRRCRGGEVGWFRSRRRLRVTTAGTDIDHLEDNSGILFNPTRYAPMNARRLNIIVVRNTPDKKKQKARNQPTFHSQMAKTIIRFFFSSYHSRCAADKGDHGGPTFDMMGVGGQNLDIAPVDDLLVGIGVKRDFDVLHGAVDSLSEGLVFVCHRLRLD